MMNIMNIVSDHSTCTVHQIGKNGAVGTGGQMAQGRGDHTETERRERGRWRPRRKYECETRGSVSKTSGTGPHTGLLFFVQYLLTLMIIIATLL